VATQGVANYLKKTQQKGSGVVVAYDTRFLSEKFASEARRSGLQRHPRLPLYARRTHAVRLVRDRPAQGHGAINFTASHNPPEYNGLKFSTATVRRRCRK